MLGGRQKLQNSRDLNSHSFSLESEGISIDIFVEMLSCKACVRRNIRNLAADVNSRQIRSFSNSTACRNQKNSTGEREGHEDEDVRELDPRIRFGSAYKSGWNEKEGGSSNFSLQKWLDSRGTRPSGALPKRTQSSAFEPMTNRAMKKNLEYLQDPLKLAITVRKYLRSDQYEHARELVEAASRGQLVTVSWNHIIDWQLSKGKINSAVKTYNEVCLHSSDAKASNELIMNLR